MLDKIKVVDRFLSRPVVEQPCAVFILLVLYALSGLSYIILLLTAPDSELQSWPAGVFLLCTCLYVPYILPCLVCLFGGITLAFHADDALYSVLFATSGLALSIFFGMRIVVNSSDRLRGHTAD